MTRIPTADEVERTVALLFSNYKVPCAASATAPGLRSARTDEGSGVNQFSPSGPVSALRDTTSDAALTSGLGNLTMGKRFEMPATSEHTFQMRRIQSASGNALTIRDIEGDWRPSGAVDGVGVFAVVWGTLYRGCWAALHDFAAADQLTLIDQCRWLEHPHALVVKRFEGRTA